jgi:hypothetical protein
MTEHIVSPAEAAAVPIEPHFTVLLLRDGIVHVEGLLHQVADAQHLLVLAIAKRSDACAAAWCCPSGGSSSASSPT